MKNLIKYNEDGLEHFKKSKPYFTKYIPVEGEIKEGDMVLRYNSSKIEGPCTDLSLLILDKRNDKKVKLFLCSRDIQVGDNVTDGNIVVEVKVVPHTHPYFVKVIGEVSSNAIWVKEGMEFEEDDIREIYQDERGNRADKSFFKKYVKFDPIFAEVFHVICEFKCPTCNTFH